MTLIAGALFSCEDREWGESETDKPSWLGGSIYQELRSPNQSRLEGTFSNYVRLIDDLDYAETLNRTGSKTVFPANDDAFERFFKNNTWGISKYEDLTEAMKKQLLYSSMLDNAYLLRMLSNVSATSTTVERGKALKHQTQLSVTDSVTLSRQLPANNSYWDEFRASGLYYVSDATEPMLVHFTREQMLNNSITTIGDGNDFEVITGAPYEEGAAYIFRNPVIHNDVTCLNGYIHQMRDVIVPPGNMAQVIRENGETNLFSRILDRFSAPYADYATTQAYNSWAMQNGRPQIGTIYQWRYLSNRSRNGQPNNEKPNGETIYDGLLRFDPGWNQYYPTNGTAISDMGAMFVPDDEAMRQHFLPGGEGAFLMEQFGKKANTLENLEENIDSVPLNIMATFINNLMQPSFIDAVPSKFGTVINTASENMGMKLGYLRQQDGQYNVKIANNGVIYVLQNVIMPDEYQAVSAPTLFNEELSVMRWAIQDKTIYKGNTTTDSKLGLDFWAYLLAMSANYAFFIPDNEAFDAYVLDPVSLLPGQTPTGLHLFTTDADPFIGCRRVQYNPTTQQFGQEIPQNIDIKKIATQFADLLNTHTVVLKTGQTLGQNHYYRTKQGAAICVTGGDEGDKVSAAGSTPQANITKLWNEKNGRAYRLDRVLQTPTQSVYTTLKSHTQFSEFLELCEGFEGAAEAGILEWLGISNVAVAPATKSAQEQLKIFSTAWQTFTSGTKKQVSIDQNLTLLNSYHYTVYAPNNDAVNKAYVLGLPDWQQIQELFDNYAYRGGASENNAKKNALNMINRIHEFVCYHLQSSYVFVDNSVESGEYQTLQMGQNDQFMKLTVSGGQGTLNVTDEAGVQHHISAGGSLLVNQLARDYLFSYEKETDATPEISTSAYAVIHELDEPLYIKSTKRFD